jgi:hypothetical protein
MRMHVISEPLVIDQLLLDGEFDELENESLDQPHSGYDDVWDEEALLEIL